MNGDEVLRLDFMYGRVSLCCWYRSPLTTALAVCRYLRSAVSADSYVLITPLSSVFHRNGRSLSYALHPRHGRTVELQPSLQGALLRPPTAKSSALKTA